MKLILRFFGFLFAAGTILFIAGVAATAGLLWHFGYACEASGASANELTPHVGDANTMIPEFKAFLVRIKKGGA